MSVTRRRIFSLKQKQMSVPPATIDGHHSCTLQRMDTRGCQVFSLFIEAGSKPVFDVLTLLGTPHFSYDSDLVYMPKLLNLCSSHLFSTLLNCGNTRCSVVRTPASVLNMSELYPAPQTPKKKRSGPRFRRDTTSSTGRSLSN